MATTFSLSGFVSVIGAAFLVARILNLYNQLSFVPGPFWAKFTDIWRFQKQNSKGWSSRLIRLHERYGKLVRIGPNHLSISDPDAVSIVYSTNPIWIKGPSYYGAATVSQGRTVPSIIAMNERQHTAVRKSVGRAFTTNSLLDYEEHIEVSASELLHTLMSHQTVDLAQILQYFAMDVLVRIAFSESLGLVQNAADVDGILAAVMARFDHWNAWGAMPSADYVFNKSPLATRLRRSGDSPLAQVSLAKLRARQTLPTQMEKKDLLQKFLDGQAKYPNIISHDEILGMIMSTIGAGADTTAGTMTYVFFLLAKHPNVKASLRNEIGKARSEGMLSEIPKWLEVNRLPYLEATIKETMRYFPVASWGLDRVVPKGGAVISGNFIPEGTVVGCQIDAIQRDRDVYGHDAHEFRPERWLVASQEQKRRMERSFIAFSAGKRTCTGLHIAWLEMKKTITFLMMNLDLTLMNPDQNISDGVRISAVKYPPPIPMLVKPLSGQRTQPIQQF